MIIKMYSVSNDCKIFTTKQISDEIRSMTLYLYKDRKEGIGSIDICWVDKNPKTKLFFQSETICCQDTTYIIINDTHKFTIKDSSDLMKLYKFLGGEDVDKFIKEFRELEKINELNKDF